MDFWQYADLLEEVKRGKLLLVHITDQLRAFVPMPQPQPVIDPVLEQQWADELLLDLQAAGLALEWITGPQRSKVVVFNDAGQVVPA